MTSPTQITVSQLHDLIGTPNCPVLIDVCIDEDFDQDPRLIPSAKRWPYRRTPELISSLKNNEVVVVCQKGLKLSAGTAALLRANGINAKSLLGGNFAWRDASLPLIPTKHMPHNEFTEEALWVTGQEPVMETIACCWLIKRFVDRSSKFLFVAPDSVGAMGSKFDATPFGIEDVFWCQREGMGIFDIMLREFHLETRPLLRLARTFQTTDPEHDECGLEAAGVSAISTGISRIFEDDLAKLEASMIIFDALYEWARNAEDSVHSVKSGSVASHA